MIQATRLHFSKYVGFFAPIGAVGGFIADVLQPLASLSTYVFWISLVATVGLLVGVKASQIVTMVRAAEKMQPPPFAVSSARA